MLSLQDIEETLDKTKADAEVFLTSGKTHEERMSVGFRLLAKMNTISKSILDKMSLDSENQRWLKG